MHCSITNDFKIKEEESKGEALSSGWVRNNSNALLNSVFRNSNHVVLNWELWRVEWSKWFCASGENIKE